MNDNYSALSAYDIPAKEWAILTEQIKSKTVIIYGIDIYGIGVMNRLCDIGIKIKCFCDPNPLKQAFSYYGKNVISPAELKLYLSRDTVVIIALESGATPSAEEVKENLINSGAFQEQIIILPIIKSNRSFPVPVSINETDITGFDKTLFPAEYNKKCGISERDKICVFVKFYNEPLPYIIRAVQSIREQTYRNLKILIVANGCGDSAKDLLRSYAALDDRIELLIFETNLSSLDNEAYSEGFEKIYRIIEQYEAFTTIDGDDCLYPDFIEKAAAAAKRDSADIVCGGAFCYSEAEKKYFYPLILPSEKTLFSGKDEVGDFLSRYAMQNFSMWAKLYMKKATDAYLRLFRENLKKDGKNSKPNLWWGCGDYFFSSAIISAVDRISIVSEPCYAWTRRTGTRSNNASLMNDYFFRYIKLSAAIAEEWRKNNIGEKHIDFATEYLNNHMSLYVDLKQLEKNAPRCRDNALIALKNIKDYIIETFDENDPKKAAAINYIDRIILSLTPLLMITN